MGKYDHIKTEDLEELYIKQNLAMTEISRLLNIPHTSLDRLLTKRGIVKSPELFKEMQSRLMNDFYRKRTEEQHLQKAEKCRRATLKRLDEVTQTFKEVNSHRTPEHVARLKASNKKFYENETPEARAERIRKTSESTKKAMDNLDPIKKEEMCKKRIMTLRNRSPEDKAITREKFLKAMINKTPEEKREAILKGIKTKRKNGTLWTSTFEKEVKDFIISLGFGTTKYITGYKENRLEIDIFIPSERLGIECNGCWWHAVNGPNKYDKFYHYNKSQSAKQEGIVLIHIWEDYWKEQKKFIKNILKMYLNAIPNIILGKYCKIKEIISQEEVNTFCKNNDIFEYKEGDIQLGLYYNEQLVQLINLKKNKDEYEIINDCILLDYEIINGKQILLNYFIKKYKPNVIAYNLNRDLFTPTEYLNLGFIIMSDGNPEVTYFKNSPLKRISKNQYSEEDYKDLFKKKKILKCYNTGFIKMIWKANKASKV